MATPTANRNRVTDSGHVPIRRGPWGPGGHCLPSLPGRSDMAGRGLLGAGSRARTLDGEEDELKCVSPRALPPRVRAHGRVCKLTRKRERLAAEGGGGARGGRAGVGNEGGRSLPPSGAAACNPTCQGGRERRCGETAKRCLRNRIKVLGSWCASTQPAPSFRAALRRASGVLDPGDRTGLWGRELEGGTRPGGAERTPMTTPGGRRDAGACVRLRKTAGAGRLAACIRVTLWHAEAALGLPASRRGVGLAQGPKKRGPQSR